MISRRTWLAGLTSISLVPHALAANQNDTLWDVIVVGSGVAGLSAATTAKSDGAKRVLVLEKGPLIGGHSLYSSGSIAAVGLSARVANRQKALSSLSQTRWRWAAERVTS